MHKNLKIAIQTRTTNNRVFKKMDLMQAPKERNNSRMGNKIKKDSTIIKLGSIIAPISLYW